MQSAEQSATHASIAYDQDFYTWTQQMALALRQRNWTALDIENLAGEIESLGKRDRRALKSRLEILIMHLLKWQFQPEQRSGSWKSTITEQRLRIQDLLADSPSLKNYLYEILSESYQNARKQIIEMVPQEPPHAAITSSFGNEFVLLFAGKAWVRQQLPITIAPNSEPEPDIAVVRMDPKRYRDRHPIPEEVYLLVEVADSSLTYSVFWLNRVQ